jgi:DNA-directed RNA polymerase-3 subunit RPC5
MKTRIKSEIDDTSLLRSIQTVGILVQGCWVVRSEVIYPDDFKSSVNGITGPLMQRAWDLIVRAHILMAHVNIHFDFTVKTKHIYLCTFPQLSKFTENRFVDRKEMIALTRLPTEEVTDMLQHVANSVSKKGWEFRLTYDSQFVNRFPEVVQRQTLIWDMKNQQHNDSHLESSPEKGKPTGAPSRIRSRNKSFSGDIEIGGNES